MKPVSLKSLKPLFLACQVLGALPCDGNLQFIRFGIFYSVAVNFVACGWISYGKTSRIFWDSKRANANFIVELMIDVRELSDPIIIGIHACSILFRRNTLEKAITGVKLLELPSSSDNVLRKVFFVISVACYAIILLTAHALCPPLYFHSRMNNMEMEFPYIISFFSAASFSGLVDYLSSHLDELTKTLQPNEKKLTLELDLTLFILDLSRSLNKFYSMQIFLICCRVLINIILSGYFIVDSFRMNPMFTPSDVMWTNFLVYIAFIVGLGGDIFMLICICSSCTNFENAVKSFNDRLFILMRENNKLCHNDKLCLYVAIKQRVQFTACGFYTLGYPLVTSIVATATTHLIILVQFRSPD